MLTAGSAGPLPQAPDRFGQCPIRLGSVVNDLPRDGGLELIAFEIGYVGDGERTDGLLASDNYDVWMWASKTFQELHPGGKSPGTYITSFDWGGLYIIDNLYAKVAWSLGQRQSWVCCGIA